MSVIVKLHKKAGRTIAAVCDKELTGKLFEENGKQLDTRAEFYNGEEMQKEETGDIIRNADGVNLVGEEAVAIGISEGVIKEENVIRIKGIPHAQATATE